LNQKFLAGFTYKIKPEMIIYNMVLFDFTTWLRQHIAAFEEDVTSKQKPLNICEVSLSKLLTFWKQSVV